MLSLFNKSWAECTKDKVYHTTIGNRTGYAVAFETSSLQVLLGIVKGPKGGITSFLIIVDPSQPIEVDKLICCDCSIGSGAWIGLSVHVDVNMQKKDFNDVAPKLIIETMNDWRHNPNHARAMADIIGFGQTSVHAFSGGQVSPR